MNLVDASDRIRGRDVARGSFMSRLLILGATGSLGRHVLRQALEAGHDVTAFVRTPSKLPPEVRAHVSVFAGDLDRDVPLALVSDHDALLNCAGHVADGQTFVDLVDRLVRCVELLPAAEQPVCWFLAGAAVLDIESSGRRGVDFPTVNATYWPHRVNFERLSRSSLDWRLLCPGPMVDEPALGGGRLRISLDTVPVDVPASASGLPDAQFVQIFASLVPEMILPYADAAAVMLANLDRGNAMSRRRVGLALPVGMVGRK
jgi:putative NADH-flavin reductase